MAPGVFEFPALRVWAGRGIEDAMTGFLANYRRQLEEQIAAAGRALFPDEVVTGDRTETLAGRRLQLRLETYAVTASDVQVFDPKAKVVAAGDLVTLPAPFRTAFDGLLACATSRAC